MSNFPVGYPRREAFTCRNCSAQWSEVAPTMRMNGSECPQCGRHNVYETFGGVNQAPDFYQGRRGQKSGFVSDIRPWKVLAAWAKMAPAEDEIQAEVAKLTGKDASNLSSIVQKYKYGGCETSADLARCIAADRLAKIAYNAPWYGTIRGPYIET